MKFRFTLFVMACFSSFSTFSDLAKFDCVVLDAESEKPMKNVDVIGSFSDDIGWRAWTESAPERRVEVRTDESGRCHLQGKTNCGKAGCFVRNPPQGYYHPAKGWGYRHSWKNLFGVWQPDNLVATIRLQRVEHPIPLCVKNVRPKVAPGTFDGTNAVLRYDLVLGDWLPPEGKGEHADLEIRTKLTIDEVLLVGAYKDFKKTFFTFSNTVRFLGKGNGCRAEMTLPTAGIKLRVAPEDGYSNKIEMRQGTRKAMNGPNAYAEKITDSDPDRCYYFRIRSRFDDKGKLVEAYYGKIYGDFNFHGRWSCGYQGVSFLYYLNPKSLDRNLEWDMKNNLCPNPGDIDRGQP